MSPCRHKQQLINTEICSANFFHLPILICMYIIFCYFYLIVNKGVSKLRIQKLNIKIFITLLSRINPDRKIDLSIATFFFSYEEKVWVIFQIIHKVSLKIRRANVVESRIIFFSKPLVLILDSIHYKK